MKTSKVLLFCTAVFCLSLTLPPQQAKADFGFLLNQANPASCRSLLRGSMIGWVLHSLPFRYCRYSLCFRFIPEDRNCGKVENRLPSKLSLPLQI